MSAPYSQGIPIPFPPPNVTKILDLVLFSLMQIVTFNNKANDVSLRVSAIDYLGVVAAHLRKDAVNSQQDTESITEILIEVTEGEKIYKKIVFCGSLHCKLQFKMNFRSNLFQTSLLRITAELFKIILTRAVNKGR